jgi:hypothetical protein
MDAPLCKKLERTDNAVASHKDGLRFDERRDAARNRPEPFNFRREGQWAIMIAGVLVLLAGAAGAEATTLFYNERGQITGSSSSSGNVTTFRDPDDRHRRAHARWQPAVS